jgi:NifB/MoaA-like Fe-S oxidoreductase
LLRIHSIHPGSPASRTGLKKTDILIACNGETLDDWFDFVYNANGTIITIKYKRGIQTRNMTIRKIPGIEWGFEFEGQSPRICRRKRIFCFIDQLPPGIRPSLFVKDDDIRYSFLQGTYVTLDRNDVSIAIKKNLSSVHVSVHASDPVLKCRLLGTGKEEPIIPPLRENEIGLLSNLLEYESRDFSGGGLICTGTLAAPFMKRVLAGSEYQILAVNNNMLTLDDLSPGISHR